MIERDHLSATSPLDAGPSAESALTVGDPALQLFGHGWSPEQETSYRGRHRAEDV